MSKCPMSYFTEKVAREIKTAEVS